MEFENFKYNGISFAANMLVAVFLLMASLISCEKERPANLLPTVETAEVSEITRTSAIISGTIKLNGKGSITKLQFTYGPDSSSISNSIPCSADNLAPSVLLEGLAPGTTYYYTLEAGNETYLERSPIRSFTTIPNEKPSLESVKLIYSGLLGGTFSCRVTDDGGEQIKESGIYYWEHTSGDDVMQGADKSLKQLSYTTEDNVFYTKLAGLEPSTSYCVQAFASQSIGEQKSNVILFTTGEPQIELEKAGTLAQVIAENEVVKLDRLSIKGDLNGSDIAFLRAILGGNPNHNVDNIEHLMGVLNVIDLSEANIVEGGSTYDGYRYTVNNTLSTGLFEGCVNLKEISLPKSTVIIEANAFDGCKGLEKLVVPEGVSIVKPSGKCVLLKVIEVVASNAAYATYDGVLFDKKLKEILWWPLGKNVAGYEWPQSIEKIGEAAFKGFMEKSVDFPGTIKEIGDYAFTESSLESVVIPESVATLKKGIFQNCTNLKMVSFGSNIGYFSDYSLAGTALESVHIKVNGFLPYVSSRAFYGVNIENCALYVPKGCKSLYRNNEFWAQFSSIVEE